MERYIGDGIYLCRLVAVISESHGLFAVVARVPVTDADAMLFVSRVGLVIQRTHSIGPRYCFLFGEVSLYIRLTFKEGLTIT